MSFFELRHHHISFLLFEIAVESLDCVASILHFKSQLVDHFFRVAEHHRLAGVFEFDNSREHFGFVDVSHFDVVLFDFVYGDLFALYFDKLWLTEIFFG